MLQPKKEYNDVYVETTDLISCRAVVPENIKKVDGRRGIE